MKVSFLIKNYYEVWTLGSGLVLRDKVSRVRLKQAIGRDFGKQGILQIQYYTKVQTQRLGLESMTQR